MRRLAPPLAALAAAGTCYVLGSELVARGQVALSKTGPRIPDLGTLPGGTDSSGEGARKDGQVDRRGALKGPDGAGATAEPKREPPPMQLETLPLPDGMSWPGKGLIEVVTAEDELIYVDGVFIGRGPLRRIPVSPGEHDVWIRKDSVRRQGTAPVTIDQRTRVVFAAP